MLTTRPPHQIYAIAFQTYVQKSNVESMVYAQLLFDCIFLDSNFLKAREQIRINPKPFLDYLYPYAALIVQYKNYLSSEQVNRLWGDFCLIEKPHEIHFQYRDGVDGGSGLADVFLSLIERQAIKGGDEEAVKAVFQQYLFFLSAPYSREQPVFIQYWKRANLSVPSLKEQCSKVVLKGFFAKNIGIDYFYIPLPIEKKKASFRDRESDRCLLL